MDPPAPPAEPPAGSRLRWWRAGGAVVVVAAAAAVAALAVAALTTGGDAGPGEIRARRGTGQALAIELARLDGGGRVSLAGLRGRPVVVNFFASWCAPCRRELPAFQSVSSRLGPKVAFLGVDHQDNRDGGLEMLAAAGVSYPSGYDPDGKVAAGYGLFGMPTTVFVDAGGRRLETHTGEMSQEQLERAIRRLFGV